MPTLFHPRPNYFPDETTEKTTSLNWIIPISRFLFSQIFIISGFNHFTSGSIGYADSMGVPMADMLVPISGLIAILGGGSILLGLHARFGGVLILLFLVPVTLMMHKFWSYTNPAEAQMQMIQFLKNMALIGGAMLFAFYGAGPVSMDSRRDRKAKR
jgi:putative oxidoreductase